MLAAYYGCNQNTSSLFEALDIKNENTFERHLNQYNVLKVDMQSFMSSTSSVEEMLELLNGKLRRDLKRTYPDFDFSDEDTLEEILMEKTVSIPNKEVSQEFIASVETLPTYHEVSRDVRESKTLLDALWRGDNDFVANGIEGVHQEISSKK